MRQKSAASRQRAAAATGDANCIAPGSPSGSGRPRMNSDGYQFTKATGTMNVSAFTASVGKIVSGYWVSVFPP